jgi:hypothetical protein
MRRFGWQTMLIFVISLSLAVILLGLATAHISKLKQQRRQLSDSSVFDRVHVEPRHTVESLGEFPVFASGDTRCSESHPRRIVQMLRAT